MYHISRSIRTPGVHAKHMLYKPDEQSRVAGVSITPVGNNRKDDKGGPEHTTGKMSFKGDDHLTQLIPF